jgi:hypothetical protein
MKENCCEDYNLNLPFSTDQQICTKQNFMQLLTQRPKHIQNSERDLHLGFLYWASKFTLFLSGYTTYQGTHTVAILKGEILKYIWKLRTTWQWGGFIFVCFSRISFLLKSPKQVWSPLHITEHCSVMKISYMHYFTHCLTPIIKYDSNFWMNT